MVPPIRAPAKTTRTTVRTRAINECLLEEKRQRLVAGQKGSGGVALARVNFGLDPVAHLRSAG